MKTILIIILVLITNPLFSKELTIRVISEYLEEYIENVNIYNENGTILGETNEFGEYILPRKIKKNDKLTLKHSNFKDTTIIFSNVDYAVHIEMNEQYKKQVKLEDKYMFTFLDTTQSKHWPEHQAEFKNGCSELSKFIEKNTNYPKFALQNGIAGKVFVRFIIEKDGTVNDIIIAKGLSRNINNESIRVIKSTSKMWIPAKVNDLPVRSYYMVTINFKIK
jgi:TonB family protein